MTNAGTGENDNQAEAPPSSSRKTLQNKGNCTGP